MFDNMCCRVVTCVTVAFMSPERGMFFVLDACAPAWRMTLCGGQIFGLKEERVM